MWKPSKSVGSVYHILFPRQSVFYSFLIQSGNQPVGGKWSFSSCFVYMVGLAHDVSNFAVQFKRKLSFRMRQLILLCVHVYPGRAGGEMVTWLLEEPHLGWLLSNWLLRAKRASQHVPRHLVCLSPSWAQVQESEGVHLEHGSSVAELCSISGAWGSWRLRTAFLPALLHWWNIILQTSSTFWLKSVAGTQFSGESECPGSAGKAFGCRLIPVGFSLCVDLLLSVSYFH